MVKLASLIEAGAMSFEKVALTPAATVTVYVVAGERGEAGAKVPVDPLGVTLPLTLGVSLKLAEVSESADIGLENVTLMFEFSGTLVALSAGLVEATVGVSAFG